MKTGNKKPAKQSKPSKPSKLSKPATSATAALHATLKSGYAGSVPGTTQDPGAVPPATASGRQVGVPPPAERVYGKAKYEAVDLGTALGRLRLRADGAMPPISGGLDTDLSSRRGSEISNAPTSGGSDRKPVEQESEWGGESEYAEIDSSRVSMPPPPNDVTSASTKAGAVFDPEKNNVVYVGSGDGDGEVDVFGDPAGGSPSVASVPAQFQAAYGKPTVKASKVDRYLARRVPVTVELIDTVVNLHAVDVVVDEYSVTVVLPMIPGGGTFTPKPGSAVYVKLQHDDTDDTDYFEPKTYECYFPGTKFDLPELGIAGLVFIRA